MPEQITVALDSVLPPVVKVLAPGNSNTISGVVQFNISVSAGTNPPVDGFVSLTGADFDIKLPQGPTDAPSWSAFFDTSKYANGSYICFVKVYDNADHGASTTNVTVVEFPIIIAN